MPTRLTPKQEQLFDDGLRGQDPVLGLRAVVRRLLQDKTPDQLLAELEAFRSVLREHGREADEDAVLEVMDFLTGWAAPHMSLAAGEPSSDEDGVAHQSPRSVVGATKEYHVVPLADVRVVFPGTSGGVWTDRPQAAALRDLYFPPTAARSPTVAVLDLTGMLPTPGVLEDLILPLAQRIRGGVYGPMILMVRTHDSGVADFVNYLAMAHHLAAFVIVSGSGPAAVEIQPVGDLTSTERTTLNVIDERGGAITASELADDVGLGQTAAGNRLVNLASKGYVYRIGRPKRQGDVFVDPRASVKQSSSW